MSEGCETICTAAVEYLAEVIDLARDDKMDMAEAVLLRILAHCEYGVGSAVRGLCDTTVNALAPGWHPARNKPNRVDLEFRFDVDIERVDAQDVPPEHRWAGQIIAARAAVDEEAYRALLASVPLDGWLAYLLHLLRVTASGLNGVDYPRGSKRMVIDSVETDDDGRDPAVIAWLLRLAEMEKTGEKTSIRLVPMSAYMLIGWIQLACRHPSMGDNLRRLGHQVVDQLAPLFAGTPGEDTIRKGWDPKHDRR